MYTKTRELIKGNLKFSLINQATTKRKSKEYKSIEDKPLRMVD